MNVDSTTFIVVDCETTGLDPEVDEVVEIAAVATNRRGENLGMFATLVNPGKAIPPEIAAVHGITDADVANAPSFSHAIVDLERFLERFDPRPFGDSTFNTILVAHNAAFDAAFLNKGLAGYRFLCTVRLAKHVWPDAPNFKNQTLRYWRGLNPETLGIAPHRALGDTLVTAAILRDLLSQPAAIEFDELEDLLAFAESPALLRKMPFGKHRGLFTDVPTDYLQWCMSPRGLTDMDPDIRFTIQTELLNRSRAA